jgi:hypothetical protein
MHYFQRTKIHLIGEMGVSNRKVVSLLVFSFIGSPDGRRCRFDQLLQITAKRVLIGTTRFAAPVQAAGLVYPIHHPILIKA